jgi:hypothetical protein
LTGEPECRKDIEKQRLAAIPKNEKVAEYGAFLRVKVHLRCIAELTSLHQLTALPTVEGWPFSSQAHLPHCH